MDTPEEFFEAATDESRDTDARERAIDNLETANDCDRLAELVRMGDIEDQYRERALAGLGHPQCKSMLQTLVEDEDVPESLADQAENLLQETADDAGAGP